LERAANLIEDAEFDAVCVLRALDPCERVVVNA
jgi:hypothetical protein